MAKERKEKLLRVLQIMMTTDEWSPLNAKQICERLEKEYDLIEVDRRSVYRDLELLQYCGYKLRQCDNRMMGWYMEQHAFDDWEIKLMMDAVQQAKCVSVGEARMIRDKLLQVTSDRGRSRFAHLMQPAACNAEGTELGGAIEIMLEAMYQKKKIAFQYTELSDEMKRRLRREGKEYKLNLYMIYWSSNNYYLIGAHDNHEGMTHYRLDRIENLRIAEEPAIDAEIKLGKNPELRLRQYIEDSVNHFLGEEVRIEVQYVPGQTKNGILYDFAGKDIRVQKQMDGTCIASFRKMNSVTLTNWFLQYADMFQVLSPESLRQDIILKLKKAMGKYELR